MNSEQAAQINAYASRFEHDQQFRTAVVGSDKSAQDMSARMQDSVSRSERAETALRAVTGFAEDMRFGESKEDRSSIDVLRDPSNWRRLLDAAENYGTSQAQRVIVDNMLASRRCSDGRRGACVAMRSTGIDQTSPINMRVISMLSTPMPTSTERSKPCGRKSVQMSPE